jgi:hypothetical protein
LVELGASSEAEMVAAFLRAEARSHRFAPKMELFRLHLGAERSVIETPNIRDAAENALRLRILAYRGYPGQFLFAGFPQVTWHRVRLEPSDFERMRCANEKATLVPLTGPSRLIADGARSFQPGSPAAAPMAHVGLIVDAIRNGETFPELIAAQDRDGSLILIEGHSRATAYMIAGRTEGAEALVARAESFALWRYY